jgi:putative flippase GtrA
LAASPVARFLAIGVASTIAYAVLYVLLAGAVGSGWANGLALAVTAIANTAANRRLTFGVRGRDGFVRQHAMGALVFVLTLALTTGALVLLHALAPAPPRVLEAAVLVVASAYATVTRYVGLRFWVFARDGGNAEPRRLTEASAAPHPALTGIAND